MEIKPKLALKDCKGTMFDVYRYYFPEASDQEVDFFFWQCTPFPFDNKKALDMLYEKYINSLTPPAA